MKKHIITLLLSASFFTLIAQEKTLSADIGYFKMGDGDYSGICYNNTFTLKRKTTCFKTGLMFLNAAELDEGLWYHRHHVTNIINYYNIGITPLQSRHLECSLSAGFSWRYRNEITFQSSKTVYTGSGESLKMITNNYTQSYDFGGNFEIAFCYKTNTKIHPSATLRHMSFDEGSGLFSINLGVSYTL